MPGGGSAPRLARGVGSDWTVLVVQMDLSGEEPVKNAARAVAGLMEVVKQGAFMMGWDVLLSLMRVTRSMCGMKDRLGVVADR